MEEVLSEGVDALAACVDDMAKCLTVSKVTTDRSTKLAINMLKTKRVFQLVSEYDVQRARLDLMEDIEPLLQKLYSKLEKALTKLERERATLSQTFELNKLRFNNQESNPIIDNVKSDPVVIVSSTHEELERLKDLKNRKEELIQRIQELHEER